MSQFSTPLCLLPERKVKGSALVVSYVCQALATGFLVFLGVVTPPQFVAPKPIYTLISLVDPVSPVAKPTPQTPAPIPARIIEPKLSARVMPPPKLKDLKAPEPPPMPMPKPELREVLPSQPPKMAHVLHTGQFDQAQAEAAARARAVQNAGFGDPNGMSAPSKPGPGRRATINSFGSWEAPQGKKGTHQRPAGQVANVGFGSGISASTERTGAGRGSIKQGGFGDARAEQVVRAPKAAPKGPESTPVEIVFKPNPVYTEEARRMRLEGDVLLEVTFLADGNLKIMRVVRGLGHGLDEAAVVAAKKMRFRPATKFGQQVDSTATVHVVFQLAY